MVKKPRANRSAAPRKPVIIEAEAKPVETGSADTAKTSAAKPNTTMAEAKPDIKSEVKADTKPSANTPPIVAGNTAPSTTPKAARTEVSIDAAKPPIAQKSGQKEVQSDKSVAGKADGAKPSGNTAGAKSSPSQSDAHSKDGSKGGGSVKGGVIGAALALLGAIGLNFAGILPGGSDNSTDISALEAKIEALSNSTATQAPEFDPSSVQPLIDAALAKQSTTFQAEIEALETQLSDAATDDTSSETSAQIAALETEIKELQDALSSGSGGENEGMAVLSTRITEIEGGVNSLQSTLSSLAENTNDAVPEGMAETLTTVQTTLAQNSEQLSALSQTLSTQQEEAMSAISSVSDALNAKISDLSGAVETLSAQAQDTSRQTDVASAIATAGLKAAIDRGGPFMTELETYAQIAPESAILEQLRPLAARGVPTQSDLIKRFDAVAYDMIAAAEAPADGEGGMLSSLMSSAKSLVKVRPVGSIEGDSAGAITARMGEALNTGDYARLEAEYATLPDAAKTAGADFISAIQARQNADALIQNVLNQALQASTPNAAQSTN